jgi:hypothetical protein
MPEESQVESCEHQNNANIHHQSFPKSVSEEREIYTDYNGCRRHSVKRRSYLSAHLDHAPSWKRFLRLTPDGGIGQRLLCEDPPATYNRAQ